MPDTVDFVMYWWHKAAELVGNKKVKRFGMITTNTITQIRQRKVIEFHQSQKNPINLFFAIPDHPWVDEAEAASVRIAMTAAESSTFTSKLQSSLGIIKKETQEIILDESAENIRFEWFDGYQISSDLRVGVNLTTAQKLKSNKLLAGPGVKLHGAGFLVSVSEMLDWGNSYLGSVIKPQGYFILNSFFNTSRP